MSETNLPEPMNFDHAAIGLAPNKLNLCVDRAAQAGKSPSIFVLILQYLIKKSIKFWLGIAIILAGVGGVRVATISDE